MAEQRVQNLPSQTTKPREFWQIPIFVYPSTLEFYLEDKASHRQKLLIYNPFDKLVLYGIYAVQSQKDKFDVETDVSAIIMPRNYVQVFFTHLEPTRTNLKMDTTFLITLNDLETNNVMARRSTTGKLLSHFEKNEKAEKQSDEENEEDKLSYEKNKNADEKVDKATQTENGERYVSAENSTTPKQTDEKSDKEDETADEKVEKVAQAENGERYACLKLRMLLFLVTILLSVVKLLEKHQWKSGRLLPKCLFLNVSHKTMFAFFFGVSTVLLWQQINNNLCRCS